MILLQESFSRTEGIEFDGRHVLFTPDKVIGNLRCPAALVNQKWSQFARYVGSDVRWVAVERFQKYVFVSLHLPHVGRGFHEFISCLHDLGVFLSTIMLPVYLGIDANTQVYSIVDRWHVGESVPRCSFDLVMSDRASILHNFLCEHALYLANTFMDETVMTRRSWDGSFRSQIDFIAAPLRSRCTDVGVDHVMTLNSDHSMVWACFSEETLCASATRVSTLRNWQPGASWASVAADLNWAWHDWSVTTSVWQAAAVGCTRRTPKLTDELLTDLLREHASAGPLDKLRLNKLIWRRRRVLKRQRAKDALRAAAERDSLPASQPKSAMVNWSKLCDGGDPQSVLYSYFADIYSLCSSDVLIEECAKQVLIDKWLRSRDTMLAHQVTEPILHKAIAKLKNGKGSPDGCSAEMYKHLPS